MSHGLKSLARELPKYGRMGDTMVAHINNEEAAILKSLGGSGTINPTTGLPEFGMFGIGGGGGFLGTGINKNASDPVSNALSNNPVSKAVSSAVQGAGNVIDSGLVSLDKTVGKVIPGGWGTVGMVAASMVPGMTPMMMGGLGALTGSGVLRKGGSFNLQGAMMGGAMAYGMSSLAQYAQGAVPTPGAESSFSSLPVSEVADDAIGSLNASQGWTGAGAQAPSSIPSGAIEAANLAQSGSSIGSSGINAATGELGSGLAGNASSMVPPPTVGSNIMAGNFADAASQIGSNISEGISGLGNKAVNAYDTLTTPETYTNFAKSYGDNVAKTGEGIKNLAGFGDVSASAASKAATAATGISPTAALTGTIYGGMGLAALEEQRNMLEQQKASNAITEAEYNQAVAEIDRSIADARNAVSASPFNSNPNRDVSIGETYYGRTGGEDNLYARNTAPESRLYAVGGSVDDEYGMDEARGLDQGNMKNGFMGGGMPSYAVGGQIDMGNGYNPFANLPSMSGPLGGIGQQQAGGMVPFKNHIFDSTNTTTQQDMMGGNTNTTNQSRSIGDILGGMQNIFSNTQPSYPSAVNANTGAQSMSPQSAFGNSPVTPFGSGNMTASTGGGNGNAFPLEGQYGIVKMAQGGVARFLSGGGDGMSDDIPARIDGKQEARLADGEFVIPADVVSHLGNGSSKAGAKQLYSMMDKVRSARTGTKKQGKQINPRKFLAA